MQVDVLCFFKSNQLTLTINMHQRILLILIHTQRGTELRSEFSIYFYISFFYLHFAGSLWGDPVQYMSKLTCAIYLY